MQIIIDMNQKETNVDGRVIVGDKNAPICINGDFLMEMLIWLKGAK